jgi:glutamate/tyrosine decarboxylase-like PLP-dependent enzyme
LAAARHAVLARVGWDVERRGLIGAPRLRVLAGAQRHATIVRALRYLGIGTDAVEVIPVDDQGRMLVDRLAEALHGSEDPLIVCAQAGEVNTGAFDPISEICQVSHAAGGWVHVDGAFGLWAAASPQLRYLVEGVADADSWATDCHKWLNVPYDSALIVCADRNAHRAAMSVSAAYLVKSDSEGPIDQIDWVPEFSRRARGFAVFAALRCLGRDGVAEMVERCCHRAQRFANLLSGERDIEVLNDVVLNQALFRLRGNRGDEDERTRLLPERVCQSGICWLSGTSWQGRPAVRTSVSNWRTSEEDVDRSVRAIRGAARG